jgi:hypothetical protein
VARHSFGNRAEGTSSLNCEFEESSSRSCSSSSSSSGVYPGVYPEMRTGVEYEAEVKEKQTAVGQKERRY